MKSHALAKSVGSQYGNQFNIAFRCSNLHTFLAKFVLLNLSWDQFYSLSHCFEMSPFAKWSFNRLVLLQIENYLVILVGNDLNKHFELPGTSPNPKIQASSVSGSFVGRIVGQKVSAKSPIEALSDGFPSLLNPFWNRWWSLQSDLLSAVRFIPKSHHFLL